jgi:hypothetical protein
VVSVAVVDVFRSLMFVAVDGWLKMDGDEFVCMCGSAVVGGAIAVVGGVIAG